MFGSYIAGRRSRTVGRAVGSICEALESRRLLSTIIWSNRGSAGNDSDNFNLTYGGNATLARLAIDRAIEDWSEVITHFNHAGGGNTFTLTVNAANLGGTQRGSGAPTGHDGERVPNTGTLTMDDNAGGGTGGWYFDPVLGDDAEFNTIRTPFSADGSNSGTDFYYVALHELGHCFGITSNSTYLIQDFITDTGVPDPNNTSNNLFALNVGGGPIEATFADRGHTYEGPAVPGRPDLPFFPDDLMAPGRVVPLSVNRRILISDIDAIILRDVYQYTIQLPSTINNMLVNPNYSTDTLNVVGQPGTVNDLIIVQGSAIPGTLHVTVGTVGGGATFTEIVPLAETNSIIVNGGDGNDILRLEYNAGRLTTFNGGNGNDFFDFAFATRNLSNITGSTQVNGGEGFDDIFVYDNATTLAQQYTITSLRFDRPGWGGFSYASDVEHETMTTGIAADTVNIPSTYPNQPVLINSAGGNDSVFLGNASTGLQSIRGEVQIHNDPAFSSILLNNSADTGNRNWLVNDVTAGIGGIIGFAAALISWDNADVNDITMLCGSGVDSGVIARLSETLHINNTNGDNIDTIRIGDPSAGGMQSITQGRVGGITIDNDPDYTELIFDDTGSSIARAITLDFVSGYNQLTGMCGATLRYDDNDINGVTIRTGSGNDTVNVLRTTLQGQTTLVTSVGGNDSVNVGNTTSGTQEISGTTLYITNPPSFSSLSINNGPDTTGRNVSIDTFNSADVVQYITGLAPFTTIQWNTSDLTNNPHTITLGSGLDTINIPRSRTNLSITTTGSNDVITIGNNISGCFDIARNITIQNPPSFTTLIVNDTGNSTGRSWTLANNGLFGVVPLSDFHSISYRLADVNNVQLNAGSGTDTFAINQFTNGAALTVRGGGGNDTLNFGNANLPNNITSISSFTFDGQGGYDTFNLQNATATGAWTYTLTAPQVQAQRSSPTSYFVGLNHTGVEEVGVFAGASDDTFRMMSIGLGTTARLNGGDGNDTFTNASTILSPLTGSIHLNGEGGTNNQIVLNDSSDFGGKIAHIDQTSISAFAGDNLFGTGSIHFQNVQRLDLTCGSGNDVIYAQPNAIAVLNLNLGAQSFSPGGGDELNLALASAQNYVITPTGAGSGTVTSTNRMPLNFSGVESGPFVDDVAPTVLASSFVFDGVPRQAITVSFSEDVAATLTSGSFVLTNLTTNQTISASDIALSYDAGTNTATLSFPNFAFGVLPDGNYRLRLPVGAAADFFGNHLQAEHTLNFFFLQGDANHDGRVNLQDFNILAANFGATGGATFSQADFNYDGNVNLQDFNILAGRFGQTLGPSGLDRSPFNSVPITLGRTADSRRLISMLNEALA